MQFVQMITKEDLSTKSKRTKKCFKSKLTSIPPLSLKDISIIKSDFKSFHSTNHTSSASGKKEIDKSFSNSILIYAGQFPHKINFDLLSKFRQKGG